MNLWASQKMIPDFVRLNYKHSIRIKHHIKGYNDNFYTLEETRKKIEFTIYFYIKNLRNPELQIVREIKLLIEDLYFWEDGEDKLNRLNELINELYDWGDISSIDEPDKMMCYFT